jgi:DnaJ-class molecular chaperone
MSKTFYEILGIGPLASHDEIKRGYKTCAMKYHPDRSLENDTTEQMKEINIAFETLSDPQKKIVYDSTFMYNKSTHDIDWNTLSDLIQRVVSSIPSLSKKQPRPKTPRKTQDDEFGSKLINITVDVSIADLCAVPQVIKKINVKVIRFYESAEQKGTKKTKRKIVTKSIYVSLLNYTTSLKEVLKGEGDELSPGIFGDIEVYLNILCDSDYYIGDITINPYTLYLNQNISLKDYFYGFSRLFTHVDGKSEINIEHSGGDKPIVLKGLGLPYLNEDTQKIESGDLHIIFKLVLKSPHDVDEQILNDPNTRSILCNLSF